jgi:3-oxoacyl-[acyl-carrier-protein] synthase II
MRLVRHGYETVVLCGGAEAPVTRLCIEGYGRTGALSKNNSKDDSPYASRPFDAARDGFVLSEGACLLVLEEQGRALRRGAKIYGEIAGYGNFADAFHGGINSDGRPSGLFSDVRPSAHGEGQAMRRSLEDAGIKERDVGLLSAHATATVLGDRVEEEAIRMVFGKEAERLPVVAAKGLTGHMLSASGAFEAALALMCMKEGLVPPYPHLENTDSGLSISKEMKPLKAKAALVNSFGFGGLNACLVLKAL